ncbi:MAG: hypothetical protein GY778_17610, partial [bacterium]|nr:hypothetical protein [bacterium]
MTTRVAIFLIRTVCHAWLMAVLLQASAAWAEISGKRPTVVDGDTLILAGARIDLHGLDAPELDQACLGSTGPWACGQDARRALIQRIGFHWVNCVVEGTMPDGALSSICYLGALGGPELNARLVAKGWAPADRPRNRRYETEEAGA